MINTTISAREIVKKCKMSDRPGYYAGRGVTESDLNSEILKDIYKIIKTDIGEEAAKNFKDMIFEIPKLSATVFLKTLYRLENNNWKWNNSFLPENNKSTEYDNLGSAFGYMAEMLANRNRSDFNDEIKTNEIKAKFLGSCFKNYSPNNSNCDSDYIRNYDTENVTWWENNRHRLGPLFNFEGEPIWYQLEEIIENKKLNSQEIDALISHPSPHLAMSLANKHFLTKKQLANLLTKCMRYYREDILSSQFQIRKIQAAGIDFIKKIKAAAESVDHGHYVFGEVYLSRIKLKLQRTYPGGELAERLPIEIAENLLCKITSDYLGKQDIAWLKDVRDSHRKDSEVSEPAHGYYRIGEIFNLS